EDGGDTGQDDFDRGAMLANWADNIIVPSYQDYSSKIDALKTTTETFVSGPSVLGLDQLRQDWKAAYLAWQHVGMFEIGKAESIGLQGYTNTDPVDQNEIELAITSGVYHLELPSRRNQQGLSGLDYMINGLAETDDDIV